MNTLLHPLTKAIKGYKVSFVFVLMLLFLPEVYGTWGINKFEYAMMHVFENVLICAAVSYILFVLISITSRINIIFGRFFLVCSCILVYILAVTDIFLIKIFGTHISTYILQLLNETNINESVDFFKVYVINRHAFKLFLFFSIIAIVHLLLANNSIRHDVHNKLRNIFCITKRKNWLLHKTCKALFFACKNSRDNQIYNKARSIVIVLINVYVLYALIHLYSLLPVLRFNYLDNLKFGSTKPIYNSFVFKFYNSVLQFIDESSTFEYCAKAQKEVAIYDVHSGAQSIIIIIGESYNRHHSSIYGYTKTTNPLLSNLVYRLNEFK